MRDAGIEVDAQTVLGIFVAALSHECYDFELRELSQKQVFDRDEIINLIEAQWNLLQKRRSKSSPAAHALIADGRGGAGGRGHPGGKRGNRGGGRGNSNNRNVKNSHDGNDGAEDDKRPAKGPICCNCRGRGHFARDCTCLLYTSPSPRDLSTSRMPSSA